MQVALKALNYYNGPTIGIYDSLTQRALRKYQQDHYLKNDGVVDWETWHSLALNLEKPVTKSEKTLPPTGDMAIIIDTTTRKLTVLSDGKPYTQFNVASGKPSTPSPVGSWRSVHNVYHYGSPV